MRTLVIATCIAVLAAVPVFAEPSERLARAIEDLLNHYGHLAGSVAACDLGEGPERTEELAAKVADWRYPSWWDRFSGNRGDYRDQIENMAMLAYHTAKLEPCDSGTFSVLLITVRDEAGRALDRETRP